MLSVFVFSVQNFPSKRKKQHRSQASGRLVSETSYIFRGLGPGAREPGVLQHLPNDQRSISRQGRRGTTPHG